jgi:hypothetical protein
MSSWIRVGAMCALIVDYAGYTVRLYPGIKFPRTGAVYTIRAVVPSFPPPCVCGCEKPNLLLEEILNYSSRCTECGRMCEPAFCSGLFRPVRDTSIEDLRSLLTPGPDALQKRSPERVLALPRLFGGFPDGLVEREDAVRWRQDEQT